MLLGPFGPWMLDQANDPAIVVGPGFVQMLRLPDVSSDVAPHFWVD